MSLPFLIVALALGADPIPPEKAAQIEFDERKAQAEVTARYGNRQLSELSQEERRQLTKDRAAAEAKVLDKHGVDAKQWARESIKRDRGEYAEGQARVKELAAKEKAEAEAAEKAKQAPTEVQVQKGFSDENPVTLEERPGEGPTVEKGLPGEGNADQEAAAEQDRLESSAPSPDPAPAKKSKGGGRRR